MAMFSEQFQPLASTVDDDASHSDHSSMPAEDIPMENSWVFCLFLNSILMSIIFSARIDLHICTFIMERPAMI